MFFGWFKTFYGRVLSCTQHSPSPLEFGVRRVIARTQGTRSGCLFGVLHQ